jgi:hypothetical protein
MPMSCAGFSRRDALKVGFLGGLGLSLADYLSLAEGSEPGRARPRASADAVIFLHLQGGPSHLDTLDLKPEAPVEERGEFQAIRSKLPGLPVCEHLPRLAAMIDQFTLIRGISHSAGAHPQANQYLFTGNRPSPALTYPSLGSVASRELEAAPAMPAFVAIPNTEMVPGYLGVAHSPLKTGTVPKAGQPFEVRGLSLDRGLTIDKVRRRMDLLRDLDRTFRSAEENSPVLEGLDRFGQKAQKMILSARTREAFDLSKESPRITQLFARDDLGQSLLLACRLIEQGVRFVTVTHGAWDTHLDNFKNLKGKLLPPFDAGITALITALKEKGLLPRTLVVATGEFGRTPRINKNAGRDHWPRTMWTLVAGGGTPAATLIGGTDRQGHGPDDRTNLKPDDLAASICRALGLDHLKEYATGTGRPVTLVPHGQVIEGLFS